MAFAKIKLHDLNQDVREMIDNKIDSDEVYNKQEIDEKIARIDVNIEICKKTTKISVTEDGKFSYDLTSENFPPSNIVTILSVNTSLIEDYTLIDGILTFTTNECPQPGDTICLLCIYLKVGDE